MANPDYPAIPEPTTDVSALLDTVRSLKEAVEILTGQRGDGRGALPQAKTQIIKRLSHTEARFTQQYKVAVSNTAAVASVVSSLGTTVGTNTSNIDTITSSLNGVSLKYGVMGSINGQTGGFIFSGILRNDGSVSYNMEFYSNVIIHGTLVVDGTLITDKLTANAISRSYSTSATSSSVSQIVSFRAGAQILLDADFSPGAGYTPGVPPSPYIQLFVNSGLVGQAFVGASIDTRPTGGTGSGSAAGTTVTVSSLSITTTAWWQLQYGRIKTIYIAPYTGDYTISAFLTTGNVGTFTISATELAR